MYVRLLVCYLNNSVYLKETAGQVGELSNLELSAF
jgi:hypothetical protein